MCRRENKKEKIGKYLSQYEQAILLYLNKKKDEDISISKFKEEFSSSSAFDWLKELEKIGLVYTQAREGKKIIKLTEKGKQIVDELRRVYNKLYEQGQIQD